MVRPVCNDRAAHRRRLETDRSRISDAISAQVTTRDARKNVQEPILCAVPRRSLLSGSPHLCHLQLRLRESARACSLCEVCDGASRVGRAHAHPRAEPAAIRSVRRGSVRQRIDRASLALRRIALLNGTHAFHACNCHGFVCVLCCRQARARRRRHEHRTVARRGALMLPDDAGDALVFPAVAVYANVYKACMGSAAAVRSCLLLVRLRRRTCCTSSRASCRPSRRYRSANAA